MTTIQKLIELIENSADPVAYLGEVAVYPQHEGKTIDEIINIEYTAMVAVNSLLAKPQFPSPYHKGK